MEATFDEGFFGPASPAVTNRGGRTTFEWLDGRFFLTQRFVVENPAAPNGIAIIGLSEEPDTFTQHYYDSRGVARVYEMSLDGNVWRLRREVAGVLAAVRRDDLRRRHHDRGRVGDVRGRPGVEARLRPELHEDRLSSPGWPGRRELSRRNR